jgi:hypothetical protein
VNSAERTVEWEMLESSLLRSGRLTRNGKLHENELFPEVTRVLP